MVLLVVDAQELITTPALYAYEAFMSNVQQLIAAARKNGVEVIYVRHDDGAGQPLSKGMPGYDVHPAFAPLPGERIFDKTVNSPFRDSGLLEYLQDKGETTLIVTGLQTDYCIDATVKCGFEHGFRIIVPAHANTTVDNPFMSAEISCRYHNEFIWNNRYAVCLPMDNALQLMEAPAERS